MTFDDSGDFDEDDFDDEDEPWKQRPIRDEDIDHLTSRSPVERETFTSVGEYLEFQQKQQCKPYIPSDLDEAGKWRIVCRESGIEYVRKTVEGTFSDAVEQGIIFHDFEFVYGDLTNDVLDEPHFRDKEFGYGPNDRYSFSSRKSRFAPELCEMQSNEFEGEWTPAEIASYMKEIRIGRRGDIMSETALVNYQCVGGYISRFHSERGGVNAEVEVNFLIVHPQMRRRGIGTQLVQKLIDFRNQGVELGRPEKDLTIWTHERNEVSHYFLRGHEFQMEGDKSDGNGEKLYQFRYRPN